MNSILKQIQVAQTNRIRADLSHWRSAIRQAERVKGQANRRALLDLMEEACLDAHANALKQKRITSITNTPLLFVMPDGEVNQEIGAVIDTDSFMRLLAYIIEAKFFGFSLIELEITEKRINPILIPRKNVAVEKGEILRNVYDTGGFSYRTKPYEDYLLEVNEGDLGILLQCIQYTLLKKGCLSDAFSFSQQFGSPFKVGYYNGHDDNTKTQMESALSSMGTASWCVIPEGNKIDFIQSNYQQAGEMYRILVELCNKELSKLILLATSTISNEGGTATSYAQSQIHERSEKAVHESDKIFVKNILNDKLLPLLKLHGFNCGDGKFQFREAEMLNSEIKLRMDISLVKELGLVIDQDYFYKQYNVPKPEEKLKDINEKTDGSELDE